LFYLCLETSDNNTTTTVTDAAAAVDLQEKNGLSKNKKHFYFNFILFFV
jgi:hypothetical protein